MLVLIAEYAFLPLSGKRDELVDAVDALFAGLHQNGQIWGDHVAGWVEGARRVTCRVPGCDSLDDRHASAIVRNALASVRALCAEPPQWSVVDDRTGDPRSWRDEKSLYFFTHVFEQTSPVCAGTDGDPIPLYLLPLSEETREQLFSWMKKYRMYDEVQLDCGPLELDAYRQLADPHAELSQDGRELARDVELAIGFPTYYYLMRYWGRPGDEDRPCPGCGGEWQTPVRDRSTKGLDRFEFRCEPCRLVSHKASSLDEDSGHPEIGEWRGPASHAS